MGQTQQPRHLARGGRQINRTVGLLGQRQEVSLRIDHAGSKVAVHLTACRHGLSFGVGVGIKLGKVLLHAHHTQHHHEGLIPVVTASEIAISKLTCKGELCHLLAISEDSEFGLAREDFFAAQQGCLPADASQAVIVQSDLSQVLSSFERECISHKR